MRLFLCTGCNRHIKDSDARCPFCGGAHGPLVGDSTIIVPRMSRAMKLAAVAAGTAVALAMSCTADDSTYGNDGGGPYPDATVGDAARETSSLDATPDVTSDVSSDAQSDASNDAPDAD